MPDRYDPKTSARPLSERRPGPAAAGDDPLAELARIVSGRAPFDPEPEDGGTSGDGSSPEGDLGRDLESELLNDLQASFAALGGPFDPEAVPPPPAPEPVARQPEPRPPEPETPQTEPRAPAARAPEPPPRRPAAPPSPLPEESGGPSVEELLASLEASQEPEQDDDAWSPPPAEAADPEPAPPSSEAVIPPFVARRAEAPPPAQRREPPPAAPRPAAERQEPSFLRRPAQAQVEQPGAAEQTAPPVRPAAPERDFSRLRLRPAPPAPPAERNSAAAPPPSGLRRQRGEDAPRPPEGLSRFAPPRLAAEIRPEPPHLPSDEADVYPEPPPLDDSEAVFEDEFTLDDLEEAAFSPDDDLPPPFPEEELADLKRRRSNRKLAVIGGVVVLAVVGGAAAYFLGGDSGSSSPPPIIAADADPSKVFPEEPAAGETDQQGKLIYDRVEEGGGNSDTTLVTTADDPITEIPAVDDEMSSNPITRVIIPGGPGIDPPIADSEGTADGEMIVAETVPSETEALGPKKVRTVVVRPDGTIVSSEAVEEGDAAPGLDAGATLDEPAGMDAAGLGGATRTEMDAVLEGEDLAVNADPLGVTNPELALSAPTETPAPGTVPAGEDLVVTTTETAEIAEVSPPEVAPEPAPVPTRAADPPPAAAERPPVAVASTNNGGPIDLTGGSAGPAVGSGGVLVQVSAQRSEEAARSTYRSLQARYPGILGPYQAAIIRADLGDRGVYYRVRIGPFSGGDAERLCGDLKAAGGDCILAR